MSPSKFCSTHKNKILFSLFFFFFETSVSFKFFFLPVYWKQIGLSATQIGALRIVWGVAYTAGSICIGYAADRWRIRKTLLLLTVFASMATPLLGMIPQRTHDVCIVTVLNATEIPDAVSESERRSLSSPVHQEHAKRSHSIQKLTESFEGRDIQKIIKAGSNPERRSLHSTVYQSHGYGRLEMSGRGTSNRDLPHLQTIHSRGYTVVHPTHSIETTSKRVVYTLKKNPKDLQIIFWIILFILAVGEFLSSAVFNLVHSAILDHLEEDKRAFCRVRLWGPIGLFISSPVTTTLMSHFSHYLCGEYQDGMPVAFAVTGLVVVASFGLVMGFEVQSAETHEKTAAAGKEAITLGNFLCQYQNVVFLFMAFYFGCCDGVVLTFAFWYLKELDVETASTVFGFSRMICSVVSVVLLWFVGPAIKAVGYTAVMSFCLLLLSGWFIGVSLMTGPWMMLLYDAVGYTAYVTGFTTFVTFYGEVTPCHLMNTVQGLINCIFLGAGCGVGGLLTGVSIDAYGPANTFRYWAFCTVALFLLFLLSQVARRYFDVKQNDAVYTPLTDSEHDVIDK